MISASQQKYITSLHLKKYRQKYRNFLVEGEKMVRELLILPPGRMNIVSIYGTERWLAENEPLLGPFYEKFNTVTEQDLKKVGTLVTPNQVLAVAELPDPEQDALPNPNALSLYLDGIQDPGNMGTILRIADWFGLSRVWCAEGCVDVFSPKVVQAGMGACFRVPVTESASLTTLLARTPEIPVIGAVMNGQNLFAGNSPAQGILVIGNEGKGISSTVEALLTHQITIPKGPGSGAESLNAGVATGIIVAALLQHQL